MSNEKEEAMVYSDRRFPAKLLNEDGTPALDDDDEEQTVRLGVEKTLPTGDTVYSDEDGNVYVAYAKFQQAGVVEAPEGEDLLEDGAGVEPNYDTEAEERFADEGGNTEADKADKDGKAEKEPALD